jgi:probable phosphoglycerate mutase
VKVIVETDGAARHNPGPAGIGAVVRTPEGEVLGEVAEGLGETTNNVAEYKALIAGLEAAQEFPARAVRVRADSMLVIRQVQGAWKVKQAHLRPLVVRAQELLRNYDEVDLGHVPREENVDADLLVNAALDAS